MAAFLQDSSTDKHRPLVSVSPGFLVYWERVNWTPLPSPQKVGSSDCRKLLHNQCHLKKEHLKYEGNDPMTNFILYQVNSRDASLAILPCWSF